METPPRDAGTPPRFPAAPIRDRTDWPVGPRFRALTCPWLSLWSPSGFQNGFHVCVQQGGRRAAILLGFGPFPWLPRFGLSGSALRLCLPGFRVTVPCPLQGPHGVSCDVLAPGGGNREVPPAPHASVGLRSFRHARRAVGLRRLTVGLVSDQWERAISIASGQSPLQGPHGVSCDVLAGLGFCRGQWISRMVRSWLRPGFVPAALISPGFGRCCCNHLLGSLDWLRPVVCPKMGSRTHIYIYIYII